VVAGVCYGSREVGYYVVGGIEEISGGKLLIAETKRKTGENIT